MRALLGLILLLAGCGGENYTIGPSECDVLLQMDSTTLWTASGDTVRSEVYWCLGFYALLRDSGSLPVPPSPIP